ncbi:pellicle/biofilm biosynthesis Wzx-like polysaccharide transporter PelG [Rubrobacter xylanophilus]|uniref:Pellicle/biofilm biosynthesis Wzx-like polysaccharide transporter PelG n=1 Tax=Rubrobacter xylanophilus TaxID=49319 RepID=A0A510HJ16_9ACTN|nr:exopolysaccharide Pel transporter PelG [Rubrobacter xylanophilus]BBL79992.1 pellicle/biofilm biosynthesis Wzx-like polysaccharide transporter PelG [Rubrobacter xylanophilus]
MAGIGFELQKALREESYLGKIRGYLYAAVISSGPWLLSVVALSLLGVVSATFLSREAVALFAATITHTFAVSLITTGLIQMVVTRYLADELYMNRPESVGPTFVAVLVLSSGVQFVIINALLALTDLPLGYRLPAAALYVAVSGLWVAMVFLSAARDYLSIVAAFAAGYLISFLAAALLGSRYGLSAYLMGFAGGQMIALGLLSARVLAEFEPERPLNLSFAGYFRRYPSLAAIGLTYNLGLWADKIVFWISPTGVDVGSFMNVFQPYDTSFFVASLVIIPSLALFTVNIETDFYTHYRSFYDAIQSRLSLGDLLAAKRGMARSLKGSYLSLFKVQGAVALLSVTVLTPLTRIMNLPPGYWPLFRVMVLGMSAQVFLLFTVLILLYLDLRGSALAACCTFLAANVVLTALTIPAGPGLYGYGFLAASVLGALFSVALLRERFGKLEYLTFSRQPMSS